MFSLALIIAGVTVVLIAVVYWVQRQALYRGYEQIADAARQIAARMKANSFRDGEDLVIAGSFEDFPAIVRFSHNQNTPGLHIVMRAPATFDLLVSPKKVTTARGRMLVRTGNAGLDSRFNARTDHPTQTRMLFNDKAALSHLEKLCCSTNTDFAVSSGTMELNELSIPDYPARHVIEHLESLDVLGRLVAKMPGAHEIHLEPVKQQRRTWVYPALGAVLLLSVVVAWLSRPEKNSADVQQPAPQYVPAGMEPLDAEHLQNLDGWRLAAPEDFSPAAAQYLQQHGAPLGGRIKADFIGRGTPADSAYQLVGAQGRRITMLAGGISSYDSVFPSVDFIAIIPKANLANVQWTTSQKLDSDGDGLLLVKDVNDPASGLVLVIHNKQIDSARPLDFSTINLYSGQ